MIHALMKIFLFITLRLDMNNHNNVSSSQCRFDDNIKPASVTTYEICIYFLRYWFNCMKINAVMNIREEGFEKLLKKCLDELFEQLIMFRVSSFWRIFLN